MMYLNIQYIMLITYIIASTISTESRLHYKCPMLSFLTVIKVPDLKLSIAKVSISKTSNLNKYIARYMTKLLAKHR